MACKTTGDISYFDGILLLAIQVTALFGNSLFLVGLVKFPTLRNVTNIFLCCLATADMIVALGPMNITFAVYICGWGPRSQSDDVISKMYLFTDVWCSTVSILSLTVIAVDRYFAIEWPFVHQRVVKPSFAIATIMFVWLISAVNASLRLIPKIPRSAGSLTNIFIAFAIPLVIMTYCYVCIALTARKHSIRIAALNTAGNSFRMRQEAEGSNHQDHVTQENSPGEVNEGAEITPDAESPNQGPTNIKPDNEAKTGMSKNFSMLRKGTMGAYQKMRTIGKELKAAKTLAIVIGAFIVTWTPFMSLIIFAYLYCGPLAQPKCYEIVTNTSVKYCKFLHYFNSALNPCLYVLLNKKWRDAFKKMLSCSKGNRLGHDSRSVAGGGW